MEYLIGSLLTLFAMTALSRGVARVHKDNMPVLVRYSQAYTYNLLKPILPYIVDYQKKQVKTQATEHNRKHQIRIVFTNEEAYWIAGNNLYVAQLVDGFVDEASTQVVDTMTMDKVQLEKVIFIVEQLTEGITNDNSNSGD